MRFGLRLFLVVSLLIPSGPVNAFSQKPSEDCVICGHACCCPEMCKPMIKKMKEDAASHCGVPAKRPKASNGCEQPLSVCSLTPKDPVSALAFQERSLISRPTSWIIGSLCPDDPGLSSLIFHASQLNLPSPIREVLTPPPEIVLS